MNRCKYCSNEFKYDRKRGHQKHCCNPCKVRKWRLSVKIRLVDRLGGECKMCGYDSCIDALEFHHKDPTKKDFQISKCKDYSFDRLIKEVDKCILLCSNCHKEEHYNNKREIFNI